MSQRKKGKPSIPALCLNPTEKANQYTNIVTAGFITAQDQPKAAPLYVFLKSDFASLNI